MIGEEIDTVDGTNAHRGPRCAQDKVLRMQEARGSERDVLFNVIGVLVRQCRVENVRLVLWFNH